MDSQTSNSELIRMAYENQNLKYAQPLLISMVKIEQGVQRISTLKFIQESNYRSGLIAFISSTMVVILCSALMKNMNISIIMACIFLSSAYMFHNNLKMARLMKKSIHDYIFNLKELTELAETNLNQLGSTALTPHSMDYCQETINKAKKTLQDYENLKK